MPVSHNHMLFTMDMAETFDTDAVVSFNAQLTKRFIKLPLGLWRLVQEC